MTERALRLWGLPALILLTVTAGSLSDTSFDTTSASASTASGLERAAPQPPRAGIPTTMPQMARRIRVPAGSDLQRALDQARPGDQLELDAGATYTGPFRLPRKRGDAWVLMTTAGFDRVAAPGQRVAPSHAGRMATLRAASGAVMTAAPGAHHYRFIGLHIAPTEGTWLSALVTLGDSASRTDLVPHHIIIERSYLHGDPLKGSRRGVALNASHAAVIDSYLSDFKEVGADSQAIAGWNGPGPFTIANNYLEAAGENVMFGGADPAIRGLVPSDIRITGNHVAKPLRWSNTRPDFEGTPWSIKNLFELKNARRVVVDGNLFEYNWPDAQNGFAILMTVRNQSGGAPWSVVEDVAFTNNVIRHVGAGVNILGRDDNHPSRQTRRIAIANNLFEDVGGTWGSGRLFQMLDGTRDVAITGNTAFHTGTALFGGDDAPHLGFVFENNIVLHNQFGMTGSGTSSGLPTLNRYFPGARVRDNLIVSADPALYPAGNLFPASLDAAGLVARGGGSYRAVPGDRYARAGRGGVAIGADIDALTRLVDRVASSYVERAAESQVPQRRTLSSTSAALPVLPAATPFSAQFIFWASIVLMAYVYAGYPLIAWLRARLWPHRYREAPAEPTISIVIAAHDEEACIEARIENLLALDYPPHRMQILIGSDGSADQTASRARRYAHLGVQVLAFRRWRGKAAVINDLIRRATGDIVLFADARQMFAPDVARNLVARFADPTVGAVSGELMLTAAGTGTAVGRGAAFYWRYEKFIRVSEGRAGSTVGATGAIYAIRRTLFEPIPNDTILDDVLIPMRIVRQGYSVQFEQKAKAFQAVSREAHQEYVRKLRTIAGTFQLFAREWWLLNPLRNPLWFETISHKGLRLMLPVFHAAAFLATLTLVDGAFYLAALTAQIAFYTAASAGHALRHASRRPIVISVPYAMCLMLWATLAGFARFITDRQHATWEQTAFDVSLMPAPARARGRGGR